MKKIEYKKRTKQIEICFHASSMLNDEEKEEILKSITPRTLINVSIHKNTAGFVPLAEYQNDFTKEASNSPNTPFINNSSILLNKTTIPNTFKNDTIDIQSSVKPNFLFKNTIQNQTYLHSIKEKNSIFHNAQSESCQSLFATPSKKPYWPDTLWKGGTLIYSSNQPEKCIGPPVIKGDKIIRFNSKFESGNLMYAYRLTPDSYHCILEYDPSGSCQWFYFQMTNIKLANNGSRKMTFFISGFTKSTGLFSNGSKVFVYSEKLAKIKGIGWYRAGTNYAYGTTFKKSSNSKKNRLVNQKSDNQKAKNKRATLQFQLIFPYDDDTVYLAYSVPYTYTYLCRSITNWMKITEPTSMVKKEVLCKTLGGIDCHILTISTEIFDHLNQNLPKRVIFLTARMHPGESNGSHVLHGLIDFLIDIKNPISCFLLSRFIFKIVPMINIDGVIEGYYRVGLEGDDQNRVWSQPDFFKHPVVYHTKQLMQNINNEEGIEMYIDFHGHSRLHGTFAYACPTFSFGSRSEKLFPLILSNISNLFVWDNCVFSIPENRKDASRCVINRELGIVNSYTIETSFGGMTSNSILYNEEMWKEIGKNVGEAIYHMYFEDNSTLLQQFDSSNTANDTFLNSIDVINTQIYTVQSNRILTDDEDKPNFVFKEPDNKKIKLPPQYSNAKLLLSKNESTNLKFSHSKSTTKTLNLKPKKIESFTSPKTIKVASINKSNPSVKNKIKNRSTKDKTKTNVSTKSQKNTLKTIRKGQVIKSSRSTKMKK